MKKDTDPPCPLRSQTFFIPVAPRTYVLVAISAGVFVTAVCLATPRYHWDMLGYVGAAASLGGSNDPHAVAYSEVCRYVGPTKCKDLVDGGWEFRRVVASRADVFETVLRFYKARVGFNGSVLALKATGMLGFPQATVLLPALAAGGLMCVLLLSGPRCLGPLTALALIGMTLLIGPGRIATPDSMYALLIASGTLAWVLGRPCAGGALLLAGMSVRFDGAIHVALLATLYVLPLAGDSRTRLPFYIATGLAAGTLLGALTVLTDYPGWAQVISHTFFEKVVSPELPPVTFDSGEYVALLARLARPEWQSGLALIHLGLVAAVLVSVRHGKLTRGPILGIVVCGMYIIVHALLFPAWWLRFFVGHYLVIDVLALRLLVQQVIASHPEPGAFRPSSALPAWSRQERETRRGQRSCFTCVLPRGGTM